MKRYIKPNTEVVLMQSEPVMAISGGGKNSFTATLKQEDASGDVLGKETEISSTSVWGEEE